MNEILGVVAQLSIFTFILTSMLAMGLSLTVKQIIDPLRNIRVVLLALLANFVLVPALAYRTHSLSSPWMMAWLPA